MAEVNSTTIDIANNQDWDKLIDRKLTTVVDPMVFRAGEIFMRGSSGKAIGDARRVCLNKRHKSPTESRNQPFFYITSCDDSSWRQIVECRAF